MTTEKKPRQMPKGGRKGGSVFPRVTLNEAIGYARKLVSKTHTSAQPQDVIYSGVVGTKGGIGAVRVSALKQYGFLTGDTKSNFSASDLAKKIAAAPSDELAPLFRQAALKPTIFNKLFETFQSDTVSKAKLKQRAADLKVHPDETQTCVELYISSMTTAELAVVEGDQIRHFSSNENFLQSPKSGDEISDNDEARVEVDPNIMDSIDEDSDQENPNPASSNDRKSNTRTDFDANQFGPRAVFNVNVNLDSSLDIEKLQKQLELLKRFGAI